MMDRRLAVLPLVLLAGTSLSGCVAVAIPAIAGSAMVGSRVLDGEGAEAAPAVAAAPVAAPAPAPAPAPPPVIKPVPVPTVTVATAATVRPTPAPAPAPAPAPVPVTPRVAAPAPAPAPMPAPAAVAPPVSPPRPAPLVIPAPAPAPAPAPVRPPVAPPVSAAAAPVVVPPSPAAYPDPARPLTPGQSSFARFVRYGQASALGARGGADLPSAMLSDPIALDGKRRRCAAGEQQVALIDLDPAGGVFAPPASPQQQPGLALGLAVLREAGVEIAWLSDLSVNQSGAVRTALEQSGLDPRGEDIISLRRDENDAKQQRRDSLAGIACIIAIAGDERADFDDRYKYLRNAEAGAGLEPVIGNGWFLIEPLLGK